MSSSDGAPSRWVPAGIRLSDHISLGVIAKTFPLDRVQRVLADTGRASASAICPPAS
jgi:hypothetical protein